MKKKDRRKKAKEIDANIDIGTCLWQEKFSEAREILEENKKILNDDEYNKLRKQIELEEGSLSRNKIGVLNKVGYFFLQFVILIAMTVGNMFGISNIESGSLFKNIYPFIIIIAYCVIIICIKKWYKKRFGEYAFIKKFIHLDICFGFVLFIQALMIIFKN